MPSRNALRVLAIGLDAAEPTLVRALAERGDMPVMRALFAGGVSGRVTSEAHIGSISVWPTFFTATTVWEHENDSFWSWNPRRMRIDRGSWPDVPPFWRAPELAHRTVGVLDVPSAPPPVPIRGFEIAAWGPHDSSIGAMHVYPPALRRRVRAVAGRHPITGPLDAAAWAWVPTDLPERSIEGVERRGRLIEHLLDAESPELFIAVFTETHRVSHMLWHTRPGAGGGSDRRRHGSGVVEVFRAVDRQIGRVLRRAGDEVAILVFSLHGMRAARGVAGVLDPLFRAVGLATPGPEPLASGWRRRAPRVLKRAYQRFVPTGVKLDLAKFGLMPRYDWSRTRAFPLPTDQHGRIRVNLEGREAAGIVARSDYARVCGEIERLLSDLRTEDGALVVHDVVRTAPGDADPVTGHLPDLVVHWAPAVTAGPCRLRTPAIWCEPGAPQITGEHTSDGFWVMRSPRPGGPAPGASIEAHALGRLLVDQLGGSSVAMSPPTR